MAESMATFHSSRFTKGRLENSPFCHTGKLADPCWPSLGLAFSWCEAASQGEFSHFSRRSKGLRSAVLIGVASLSLAACGSGGGITDTTSVNNREEAVNAKDNVKEKSSNNRSTATRTTTPATTGTPAQSAGIIHVGFNGGNFSSDEILNIANRVNELEAENVYITLLRTGFTGINTKTKIYPHQKAMLAVLEGNVSYTLKFHELLFIVTSSDDLRSIYRREIGTASFELTNPTDLPLDLDNDFSYKQFKNNDINNAKIHAEVATDYAADNATDWISWGFWVQVPKATNKFSDYNFGAFNKAAIPYAQSTAAVTGTATYEGSLIGLHTELESNGRMKLSRLTGDAEIVFDFKTTGARGDFTATLDNLKLNGTAATGSITFSDDWFTASSSYGQTGFIQGDPGDAITINGSSYQGTYQLQHTGPSTSTTTQPTGLIGIVDAATDDRSKSFVASFGAKQ